MLLVVVQAAVDDFQSFLGGIDRRQFPGQQKMGSKLNWLLPKPKNYPLVRINKKER